MPIFGRKVFYASWCYWLEEELWMPPSTWGGPEQNSEEMYPVNLLAHLLKQMMLHFGAQGACVALHDERIGQMRVLAHLRLKNAKFLANPPQPPAHMSNMKANARRPTLKLESGEQDILQMSPTLNHIPLPPVSTSLRTRPLTELGSDEVENVEPQQSDLFAVGSAYPIGHDLIGYTWHKNEAYAMRHEDYVTLFRANLLPLKTDIIPSNYLIVPIRESTLTDEMYGHPHSSNVLGVILLYHVSPNAPGFKQLRVEALNYVERIALYVQNDKLHRIRLRTSEYLQLLQNISTAFPSSVQLSELVERIRQFVMRVVDVSSMLLTFYDRDLDRLYDVLAINNGQQIEGLAERPMVHLKSDRPVWCRITQKEQLSLLFSPAQEHEKRVEYQELLMGLWGNQIDTESFLLLPMKMFNRVIGSLCLTSMRPNAFQPEEIQVLETMIQIVTVSIENANLYERDRSILNEARQREAQLAAINSALQSISSVLNVTELLNNLVESVAAVVKVELCAFFEPYASHGTLYAHALYAPSSVSMMDDGSGMPVMEPHKKDTPDEIINQIQLPFQGTFLEQEMDEGFFYLDSAQLEELALGSNDAGTIFLRETGIERMLMIPMSYQTKFMGFLAVPTPRGSHSFRPKDIGTLLAICAQAASAIRNAQLFEQSEKTNAELGRMNTLKDEFLVTASHELRTPLTAIRGYSSQLQRQSSRANPQQIMRFATKIAVAAQQLSDLVGSMTEAAQIGPIDQKIDLRIEPVQVNAAAEIAVSMLTLNSERTIVLDVPADIWISGDAAKLRQVLTNLLENASKYSYPDTPIQVSATSLCLSQVEPLLTPDQVDHTLILDKGDISVVVVRVQDRGEGILPGDQLKIFEKFVRATRSLTTPVRGSGLGLYICRRYVEAMGGKLWLEHSIANEGSMFSFYLPQVAPPVGAVE
jgi:signal transduction histidine kinase